MRKKGIALVCVVLSLIILQINVKLISAQEEVNLFDKILIQTKSETVEYGLKTSFKTKENPKEMCNYLIKSLENDGNEIDGKEIKLISSENEDSYCIEFSGANIKGYIEALKYNNEAIKYNNENNITINISKLGNKNELASLNSKVLNIIGSRGKNIKCFQYLKAKITDTSQNVGRKDLCGVNNEIIKLLKLRGAKNIETLSINNGLSTLAYTKNYDEKIINNKIIDFNYAVCNYSSGLYIIIGTPEIIITY